MNPAVRLLLFGGRFNPLSLFAAGEQGGWWDPSDFSTMYQDSAGTTPVTATGQPVGKINDKSGRGNHRTQSTAASRPTLQQDASGYYYLSYDGVDDFMVTGSVDFSGTSTISAFCGANKQSDAARAMLVEFGTGGQNGSFQIEAPTSAAANYQFAVRDATTTQTFVATTYAAPISNVLTLLGVLGSSTAITARINGAQVTSSTTTAAVSYGNYPLYFGRRAGTTLPFNGREYGTIIRGAVPTATQISQAERYIGSKMGIAL